MICIDGKTGPRKLRLVNSTAYLANWMSIHPDQSKRENFVWVNLGTRNRQQLMKSAAITKMLKVLFGRAGIKKRSNPHSFRHARATFLANHLTEFQMNQYFGWVQGSDMPSTYVHLSGREIDGALLKLNGIAVSEKDKVTELKAKKCPRCAKINAHEYSFCAQCGGVLDITEAIRLEQENDELTKRRGASEHILSRLLDDPEVQNIIKQKLMTMGIP
ncbi:MAG TPA: tyrosine-type recombinase/integrase [Candidatus Nanoarchaeia archaeon]|nr:tyrosine-type recombinase/integrase [Candidatus Nanoarchaeia archaeon]